MNKVDGAYPAGSTVVVGRVELFASSRICDGARRSNGQCEDIVPEFRLDADSLCAGTKDAFANDKREGLAGLLLRLRFTSVGEFGAEKDDEAKEMREGLAER